MKNNPEESFPLVKNTSCYVFVIIELSHFFPAQDKKRSHLNMTKNYRLFTIYPNPPWLLMEISFLCFIMKIQQPEPGCLMLFCQQLKQTTLQICTGFVGKEINYFRVPKLIH